MWTFQSFEISIVVTVLRNKQLIPFRTKKNQKLQYCLDS